MNKTKTILSTLVALSLIGLVSVPAYPSALSIGNGQGTVVQIARSNGQGTVVGRVLIAMGDGQGVVV